MAGSWRTGQPMRARRMTTPIVLAVVGVLFVLNPWTSSAGAVSSLPGSVHVQVFPGGMANWEPTVATDPSSHYVYQAVTIINGSAPPGKCPLCRTSTPLDVRIFVRASPDGGATWGPARPICLCLDDGWQFDPQLAVSDRGTVYAVFLQKFDPGAVLYKSFDHGLTWVGPTRVASAFGFSDKPILLVSPSGQDVYVAFRGPTAGYVAVSHTYGTSFLAPVQVTNVPTSWSGAYGGTIAPNGDVYFADMWQLPSGLEEITVLRSPDGGGTWTATIVDASDAPPPCAPARAVTCYYAFFEAHEAIAAGPSGSLMLVYTANSAPGRAEHLYIMTSADGVHWNARMLLNAAGDSFAPQIAAGPSAGEFEVSWQDDRGASCDVCGGVGGWSTWFTQTRDGGTAWSSAVRVSVFAPGAPYNTRLGYLWPDGDYFGLATSDAGTAYLIWGEADAASLYCCGSIWTAEVSLAP
jgi:hypothetical protein